MSSELSQQILIYAATDVVLGAIAWFVLWLLRTRWLVHLGGAGATSLSPNPGNGDVTATKPSWWRQALYGATFTVAIVAAIIGVGAALGGYSPGPGWHAFKYELAGGVTQFAQAKLLFLVASLSEELLFRVIGVGLLAMLLAWIAELVVLPKDLRCFGSAGAPAGSSRSARIGFRRAELPDEASPARAPALPTSFRRRAWLASSLTSALVVSLAFGFVHLGNPNASLFAGVNVALAGLWLGLLFLRSGARIWSPWAAHWVWNVLLAAHGLPVSGIALMPPPLGIGFTGARDGLLTGGSFGPEGSSLCTIMLSLACAWLLWDMLRNKRISRDAGMEQAAEAQPDAVAS